MNVWNYIKSDLVRYTGRYSLSLLIKHLLLNNSFKYSFWLRLTHHENLFVRLMAKAMNKRLSGKYLIQIPPQTQIGYGLYIGHHMCIVISPSAKIGNNVNLSQFTSIGTNCGNAASIGNNVYIGPNVNIIEDVIIGDNSTIGAGSVVTKNVPENATVAGVPAKVISYKEPGRFVNRRWELSGTPCESMPHQEKKQFSTLPSNHPTSLEKSQAPAIVMENINSEEQEPENI